MLKKSIKLIPIIFIFLSCSENINLYKNGEKSNHLEWDIPFTISVKVPNYSICWVTTEAKGIDYFSGAILSDSKTAHIGKGEFVSTLDYLNFNLTLNTKFSVDSKNLSDFIISIDCNNGEFLFTESYKVLK